MKGCHPKDPRWVTYIKGRPPCPGRTSVGGVVGADGTIGVEDLLRHRSREQRHAFMSAMKRGTLRTEKIERGEHAWVTFYDGRRKLMMISTASNA